MAQSIFSVKQKRERGKDKAEHSPVWAHNRNVPMSQFVPCTCLSWWRLLLLSFVVVSTDHNERGSSRACISSILFRWRHERQRVILWHTLLLTRDPKNFYPKIYTTYDDDNLFLLASHTTRTHKNISNWIFFVSCIHFHIRICIYRHIIILKLCRVQNKNEKKWQSPFSKCHSSVSKISGDRNRWGEEQQQIVQHQPLSFSLFLHNWRTCACVVRVHIDDDRVHVVCARCVYLATVCGCLLVYVQRI